MPGVRTRLALAHASLLALTAFATAQNTHTVYFPDSKYENDEAPELMFWLASPFDARRQIILEKDRLSAPIASRLETLTFRLNGEELHETRPGRIHVEMWVSNTKLMAADLCPHLPTNRGLDHRLVFSGWITLPKTPSASSSQRWLAPWAVDMKLTNCPAYLGDNLLLETVTRVDPAARPWWPIDANEAKSHGDVSQEGKSCIPGLGDDPAGAVKSTGVLGGTLCFYLRGPRDDAYGIFLMGIDKLDVDLTGIGAPGCRLYVDPFWTWPIFYNKRASLGAFGSAEVHAPLPYDPRFHDEELFGQWIVVSPTENALGLTMSNRVKVKVKRADGNDTAMRMCEAVDLASNIGNVFIGHLPVLRLSFLKS